MLTLNEALIELNKITTPGKSYTAADLIKIAEQVTLDAAPGLQQGELTLLYSGEINGVASDKYVARMIEDGANIRVIDKTQVGKFLASEDFTRAFLKVSDANALYHGSTGPWAKASARFVADTAGEVRLLGFNASPTSVFVNTELKAALAQNTRITSIEGIPIAELKTLPFEDALNKVKASSLNHAEISGFKVVASGGGALQSVSLGDFLKAEVLNVSQYTEAHPKAAENIKNFWKTGLTEIESSRLKTWVRGAGSKLGVVGSFLVFSIAFSEAANAAEGGNTEKARQIMETWAIEAAGGSAGAAIGSAVVALAVGAAAVMGAAVSAPVVAVLAIGAGIIGGIYGSEAATDAWAALRGNADNDELNFLEQLAARVSLSDYNLVFGSRNADNLSGSVENDYLFGGGGNDVLLGNDGNDVLRGGAGGDDLKGNAGSDQLDGGDDNDTLDGGAGSDTLSGGAGLDKYVFADDFGNDVIIDSDASGQIEIDGQTLSAQNAKKISANTYRDKSTGWTFFKGDVQTDGTATLVISKEGARNSSITVRNWKSGQMGINLSDTQEETPTGLSVFKGDQRALIYGVELIESGTPDNTYAWYKVTRDPATGILQGQAKVEVDFADVLYGTDEGDDIQGLGGNDALNGGSGNDKIDGGTGNDLIGGGSGSDTIQGGAGNDEILGGYSINVPQRRSPSDKWIVPPEAKSVIISGPTWGVYDLKDTPNEYIITGAGSSIDDQPDYIDGGAGNDSILGGWGNDYINGGDDKDVIDGLAGADLLYGGAGDDFIRGDGTIKPGYLETTAAALHGNDLLDGGLGNDTLIGQGGKDMLFGGDNDDRLWGDSTEDNFPVDEHDEDTLDGGAGNDQIIGGGKNDLAYGGAGNDTLWGDDQADRLATSAHGNDTLDGGIGDDQLTGGGRDDLMIGGTGKDSLWGDDTSDNVPEIAHGKDTLQGGQGDDELLGGGEADELFGGDDNDKLWGDDAATYKLNVSFHGADYLDGGKGDDQLIGGGKNDTLIGGDGADNMWGDGTGQEVDVAAHGKDYLSGDQGNDQLIGGGEADELHGGTDNDTLYGDDLESKVSASVHGNDVLYGDDGLDMLIGGGKDDTLFGGNGNDTLWGDDLSKNLGVAAHGKDQLYGGDGTDQLIGGGSDDQLFGSVGADVLIGDDVVANVTGDAHGADLLDGGADNDTLFGDGGNDTLMGGSGDDFLAGEHQTSSATASQSSILLGDDLLMGEDGQDVLLGGEGKDTLDGGSGNDTLVGGAGSDEYRFDIGSGLDTVYLASTDAVADTIQLGAGLKESDIVFSRTLSDLTLKVAGGVDQLTLVGFFDRAMDVIRFGDNTAKTGSNLASNTFVSTANADTLSGYSEGEFIFGDGGNDNIAGNGGNDTLDGGAGNDLLAGGNGADVYLFGKGSGQDTISYENSLVVVGANPDIIQLGSGIAVSGVNLKRGTSLNATNDLIISINGTSDTLTVQRYLDSDGATTWAVGSIKFADGAVLDVATVKATLLQPTEGNDRLIGYATNDILNGGGGDDRLEGNAGNDTLDGGAGNDFLRGDAGRDTYLFGVGSGQDTLYSPGNEDSIQIVGAIKPENLKFTISGDSLLIGISGTGDQLEVYRWIYVSDYLQPTSFLDITFADGKKLSRSDILERIFTGTAQNESIAGTSSSEKLSGLAGNDSITANDGNDTLVGGEGNDTLDGGYGTNTYLFKIGDGRDYIKPHEMATDSIVFDDAISPDDVVLSWDAESPYPISANLAADLYITIGTTGDRIYVPDFMKITGSATTTKTLKEIRFKNETWGLDEILAKSRNMPPPPRGPILGGSGSDLIIGTNDANLIYGGAGNDTVDGMAGDDTIFGGSGQNTYIFHKGSGSDTILPSLANETSRGIDTLFLEGITPEDVILSSSGYAYIGPNDYYFNGQVYGGGYVRILIKETGEYVELQNFYDYHAVGDFENKPYNVLLSKQSSVKQIVFGNGIKWDYAKTMQTIYGGSNVDDKITTPYGESVEVHGGSGNDTLSTSFGNDALYGGEGDDYLIAGDGNDTLYGGEGDDYLSGGSGRNVFQYEAGYGSDKIFLADNKYIASENLLRFGKNIIKSDISVYIGPEGNGYYPEPLALYLMNRATGDAIKVSNYEIYHYNATFNPNFSIAFDNDSTWDRDFIASVARSSRGHIGNYWGDELTVEGLTVELYGMVGDDTLTGGSTNDSLYGGIGSDSLNGLGGNDFLMGQAGSDVLFGGTGNDSLDGGTDNDWLYGEEGDDTLIGGSGADTMVGGAGHDVYYVDNINDAVIETTPNEYDRVVTSVTFTLAEQVENLALAYGANAALQATGNTLDNTLEGNEFDNVLSGLAGDDYLWGDAGNDTLIGGLGNDHMYVDSLGDVVQEDADGGYDTVLLFNLVADTYTLGANIEAAEVAFLFTPETQAFATLNGNELDNSLTAGDDGMALYGQGGDDQLFGGGGDDSLYGGTGNDALWAMSGADSVLGGAGNDQYYVSDANNRITEYANEGIDTVTLFGLTTNSYTLSDNVENLDVFLVTPLSGNVITLTGNAQNNGIEGNANGDTTQRYVISGGLGNDTLFGSDGNDTLDGGVGNDSLYGANGNDAISGASGDDTLAGGLGDDALYGGTGNDTYQFARGDGQDVVIESDATAGNLDRLNFGTGVSNDQLWFSMSGQDLVVSVIGTTDRVTIQQWSAGAANHVEQFSAGGKTLADTQVANLVQAMASMSPPASGQTTLSSTQRAQLDPVLAASWA